MVQSGQTAVFGRRREPHTVIIARGDEIRHFTVRPWLAAAVGSALSAIAIGYLLATSYLVLRDDLIGATAARQARMQQAYEDRISALRAQVDRITSRQMLDQQLMETKVVELLERQSQLTRRHGRLLDKAQNNGEELPGNAPVPAGKPSVRASLPVDDQEEDSGFSLASANPFALWSTREGGGEQISAADRADKLFVAINQSLRKIESEQMEKVSSLAEDAYETADAIAEELEAAGLKLDDRNAGLGGPFVAIDRKAAFDTQVKELDEALDTLDKVKTEARRLPLANPAPDHAISSSFGVRRDPLIGTPAMHAGMDFRAPMGADARAGARGKVVKAGWNGGYGRMVEIDHGGGMTTRYAHLSKIVVAEGQTVEAGDIIGKVGSSGRSTGPHLHYEIRRNGKAVDPLRFLKLGKRVARLL